MTAKSKYRSLDLLKALAKGWQPGLNGREHQVLLYVAQYGRQNEPGLAFTWHPMRGVDWWAEDMSMPRATLYRSLSSLKTKGLLVTTKATEKWGAPGYGIPVGVMDHATSFSPTHGTLAVSDVRLSSPRSENQPPPMTRGNEPHNQCTNHSMKQLLTQPPTESAVQEDPMYDDFDRPKDDGVDDFAVPRDAKEKKPHRTTVAHRLMKEFYEQWSIARCQNTSFGVAFNNQQSIMAAFKKLLTDYSEDDIKAMIKVFFDQAVAGRVYLSGNEMWRDFLNARNNVWQIVQASGTMPVPMEDPTERNRRNLERLRAQMQVDA